MAVLRKINSTTELFYEEGGWVRRGGILLLQVFIFVKNIFFNFNFNCKKKNNEASDLIIVCSRIDAGHIVPII